MFLNVLPKKERKMHHFGSWILKHKIYKAYRHLEKITAKQ